MDIFPNKQSDNYFTLIGAANVVTGETKSFLSYAKSVGTSW